MKHIQASFQAAVEILVGDGPVKKRLCRAFEEHLIGITEADLPAGVRDDYRSLHAALHSKSPIGPQSCIQATVQKMSSADATRHAVQIFSMHLVIEGRPGRSDPLRVTEPLQFVERAVAAAPRFLDKRD